MINLMSHPLQKIIFFFTLLMSFFVLQGCGSERDTPFVELGTESSAANHGKEITFRVLANEPDMTSETTGSSINKDQKWDVITDDVEFKRLWSLYSKATPETVDFTKGQVVLFDSGENKSCEAQYRVEGFKVYEDGAVIITVSGRKKSSSSSSSVTVVAAASSGSSSSDCSASPGTQAFAFYYVQTLDQLYVTIQ
jgi:hypothetical protein